MNMAMNRTALSGPEAEIAKQHLQETLVDLIDLGLQGKQAHWNVVGPRFRSLHLQLDELVDHARGFADTVAERIVTLGDPAEGGAKAVDHQSKLDPLPSEFIRDSELVKMLVERLDGVCTRMRRNLRVVQDRDPVSHDILVQCLTRLEEQMWMLHAQTAG